MLSSLIGRVVFIRQARKADQLDTLARFGRVVATFPNGEWLRVVVNVPGYGLFTYDAGDLVPVTRGCGWVALLCQWFADVNKKGK